MERVYVDTNVYMDYFLNRVDRLRPLGDFAFNLMKKIIKGEYTVVISDLIIIELEYNDFEKEINILLEKFKESGNLIFVKSIDNDNIKTNRIVREKGTDFNDTKHAVIADRINVDHFVTRNVNDFEKLGDLVYPIYPENL